MVLWCFLGFRGRYVEIIDAPDSDCFSGFRSHEQYVSDEAVSEKVAKESPFVCLKKGRGRDVWKELWEETKGLALRSMGNKNRRKIHKSAQEAQLP